MPIDLEVGKGGSHRVSVIPGVMSGPARSRLTQIPRDFGTRLGAGGVGGGYLYIFYP